MRFFRRTDYQFTTLGLAPTPRACAINKQQKFSDHAPLTVEYDFEL